MLTTFISFILDNNSKENITKLTEFSLSAVIEHLAAFTHLTAVTHLAAVTPHTAIEHCVAVMRHAMLCGACS